MKRYMTEIQTMKTFNNRWNTMQRKYTNYRSQTADALTCPESEITVLPVSADTRELDLSTQEFVEHKCNYL